MRSMTLLMIFISSLFTMACEAQEQVNKPRTMIIGGMPAHDHDYRLPEQTSIKPRS
jgi:hypothetical protein